MKIQVAVFWVLTPCSVAVGCSMVLRNAGILPHDYRCHNLEDRDLNYWIVHLKYTTTTSTFWKFMLPHNSTSCIPIKRHQVSPEAVTDKSYILKYATLLLTEVQCRVLQ